MRLPLLYAFTGKQTVYGIVKTFYSCENQVFINEEFLKKNAPRVDDPFNDNTTLSS